MDLNKTAELWAEKEVASEAEAFESAIKRIKPNEEPKASFVLNENSYKKIEKIIESVKLMEANTYKPSGEIPSCK